MLQPEALAAIGRLADQLGVIFSSRGSDVGTKLSVGDVIAGIDQVIKRMSKL
jgi:hypothetical protein